MAGKILIVDDEAPIRQLVRFNLEKAGYAVSEADNGRDAVRMAQEKPDLIVLDLMLPEIDGLEVCRQIKGARQTSGIPVIMLTARDDEFDKVVGLELGADDYMTKPFSPRELVARIKAVLRRSQKVALPEGEFILGNLRLNFARYEVFLGKEKLELTPKEYELLKLLVTNVGKVFTREQLLEKVWGYEYFGDTRTVDVHVRHLRAKLELDRGIAEAIETVRGIGYRFREV
ncbi:MAG: response regulator transcription factor [Negativicutes bacterium]|nr:response regulator transcription factor [Negativicutes bacterium]